MVHIDNICPDFFSFWEQAQGRDHAEQIDLWQTLYEDRHRDIFDVYYRAFGRKEPLGDALRLFPQAAPIMRAMMGDAEKSIARIVPQCARLFDVPAGDVRYVLMVGLFQSDAWATYLHGQPTSFLTLEHVASPRQMEITVAHETAHTLHHLCASPPLVDWVDGGTVADGVFTEGMAVLASTRVVPGASDAAYLNNHGPDGAVWLAACAQRWGGMRPRLLADLSQADPARARPYFLANTAMAERAGLPVRIGYVAGYYALVALGRGYTIAEMAQWPNARVLTEVRQVLEDMEQLPIPVG